LTRIFHVRVIARERDPDLHCVILVTAQAAIRARSPRKIALPCAG
jgi:hypothetical protein